MKRQNIAPKVLAAENSAITQFLFDVISPLEGGKVPIQFVFDAYQKWRSKNKLAPTILSVDGFGRLFPNAYPRRSSYWPPAKQTLKCVFGVGLRV